MLRLLACGYAVASPRGLMSASLIEIAKSLPACRNPAKGRKSAVGRKSTFGANPHFKLARFGYNRHNKQ
jgi:hypothetical protein